jgi:hypothetical protein
MTTINPPSTDIVAMLEDSSSGLGLVLGTDLFINGKPTSPSNLVVVFDTGGMGQLRYGMERPNVQLLVRNTSYRTGYALAKDIKYFLHEKVNEIWNTARYIQILARTEINYLGKDSQNRFEFSLNFMIIRTALS